MFDDVAFAQWYVRCWGFCLRVSSFHANLVHGCTLCHATMHVFALARTKSWSPSPSLCTCSCGSRWTLGPLSGAWFPLPPELPCLLPRTPSVRWCYADCGGVCRMGLHSHLPPISNSCAPNNRGLLTNLSSCPQHFLGFVEAVAHPFLRGGIFNFQIFTKMGPSPGKTHKLFCDVVHF